MASSRGRPSNSAIVTMAAVAAIFGVLLTFALVRAASEPDSNVKLGDDVFVLGSAEDLSARIESDGVPLLFQDLIREGRGVNLYVQHLGSDPNTGWTAFDARVPGAGEKCLVEWRTKPRQFVDPCSKTVYPADGLGLTQFLVQVKSGTVEVDLRKRVPG